RSAYVTATDRLAARLFGNRSVQPRLQTVDGDIARPSEKFASLICVRFIGVSFHGHSQLRPVQESITLNRDLSQNVLKTRRNSGRALSPVSSQRGVLATRMRLVQTRQHRAGCPIAALGGVKQRVQRQGNRGYGLVAQTTATYCC